jgi:hypothetical protein
MFDAPGKMTACVIASLVMLAGMRADAQSGANVLLAIFRFAGCCLDKGMTCGGEIWMADG